MSVDDAPAVHLEMIDHGLPGQLAPPIELGSYPRWPLAAHVLVAEDDLLIGNVIQELLEDEGYQVERVANGDDVLAQLAHSPVDLLLLDMRLPGIDGLMLCRIVRHSEQQIPGHLPIILVSALPTAIEEALAAGADAFVAKPFDLDVLVNTMVCMLRTPLPSAPQLVTLSR